MMAVSRASRNTTRKIGTEKTSTAMLVSWVEGVGLLVVGFGEIGGIGRENYEGCVYWGVLREEVGCDNRMLSAV